MQSKNLSYISMFSKHKDMFDFYMLYGILRFVFKGFNVSLVNFQVSVSYNYTIYLYVICDKPVNYFYLLNFLDLIIYFLFGWKKISWKIIRLRSEYSNSSRVALDLSSQIMLGVNSKRVVKKLFKNFKLFSKRVKSIDKNVLWSNNLIKKHLLLKYDYYVDNHLSQYEGLKLGIKGRLSKKLDSSRIEKLWGKTRFSHEHSQTGKNSLVSKGGIFSVKVCMC